MNKLENKKYTINVNDSAFNKDVQASNISGVIYPYSEKVHKLNENVEVLDRFDDFDALKIDFKNYEKVDGSKYGIEYDSDIHVGVRGDVILEHQKEAALRFLRDLRGFGVLADVVGSGKTYEACVVLSELAFRGKLKSLLLVVPSQVYTSWVYILENKFGLGEGELFKANKNFSPRRDMPKNIVERNGFVTLNRPVIVKMEDFITWDEEISKLLFDAIVVDEAHHLCNDTDEGLKTLRLLSLFMETKKKANSTYCILLTATPHSGNLDKMFRLWYFVRTKGGDPSDFTVKDDKDRTSVYNDEKQFYHENVCRGADTVMEFIKNVKRNLVLSVEFREDFKQFLVSKASDERYKKYGKMPNTIKDKIVDEYINQKENKDKREAMMNAVASAYHNGVLRTIMIRQSSRTNKIKNVINVLFFPVKDSLEPFKYDKYTVYPNKLSGKDAIEINESGEKLSIEEYAEMKAHDKATKDTAFFNALRADAINDIYRAVFDEMDEDSSGFYTKDKSLDYYLMQLNAINKQSYSNNTTNSIIPFKYNSDNSFNHKYKYLEKILEKEKDKRIIVFFDYDKNKQTSYLELFKEKILESKFKDRLLFGNKNNRDEVEKKFNEKSDTILVVEDQSFTEGINLQESNIIVNFEITPDPLSMDQRIGRIFRLGQKNDVFIYSLADANLLEGYVLMYYNRIGLMQSNSGDATIIAGCNNEKMVTIRCPKCGDVELLTKDEYNLRKSDNKLGCATPSCAKDGMQKVEISVYDFMCDDKNCSSIFTRSSADEGYTCMSVGKGIMCSGDKAGDKTMYCSKICAMKHCSRLKEAGCKVLEALKINPNIDASSLYRICRKCNKCAGGYEDCMFDVGKSAIKSCSECRHSTCTPKPYVISFNEEWEAECPVCHHGTIKPVKAKNFATYIKSLWNYDQDKGKSFCSRLLEETGKVTDIKEILSRDEEVRQ